MRKHIIAGLTVLAILLLYRQVALAQYEKDLSECVARFEKIRIEARKAEPGNLSPYLE